jgi:hypothetical protein
VPNLQDPPFISILSQINPVHALPSCFFKTYFNIILSLTHRSSKWSLSFIFPHTNPVCISLLTHTWHEFPPSHPLWCNHWNNIWWGVKIPKLQVMQFFFRSLTPVSQVQTPSLVLCSLAPSAYVLPLMWHSFKVAWYSAFTSTCSGEKNSRNRTLYSVRWVDVGA